MDQGDAMPVTVVTRRARIRQVRLAGFSVEITALGLEQEALFGKSTRASATPKASAGGNEPALLLLVGVLAALISELRIVLAARMNHSDSNLRAPACLHSPSKEGRWEMGSMGFTEGTDPEEVSPSESE